MSDSTAACLPAVLHDYGYPSIVLKVIAKFRDLVVQGVADAPLGILLVGSAARGELCFTDAGQSGCELFSDLEFLVAADRISTAEQAKLRSGVDQLVQRHPLGALFGIDYTCLTWSQVDDLERKFFVFEAKSAGVDLTEQRVAVRLPRVDHHNLNYRELNEVLVHRLRSLLGNAPLCAGALSMQTVPNYYPLCIAKNCLDVTTWIVPYVIADRLIVGFESRVCALAMGLRSPGTELALDVEDVAFLQECITVRQQRLAWVDLADVLTRMLRLFRHALHDCLVFHHREDKPLPNAVTSAVLFDEYAPRKRARIVVNSWKKRSSLRYRYLLSSALFPVKGPFVYLSMLLLQAYRHLLQGDEVRARALLIEADRALYERGDDPRERSTDITRHWLQMREDVLQRTMVLS